MRKVKLYEKYAKEVPQEAMQIIASLGDPTRIAILVLLSKYGDLSFSDIQKELGLAKLTLNYHLKNLYSAGMTDHYFRHEFGNQKYSYYSVTSLGKRTLSSLVSALVPPVPFQNMGTRDTSEKYELISQTGLSCSTLYLSSNKSKPHQATAPSCMATKSLGQYCATSQSTYTKAG